jgi:hypothetical protein
MRALFPAHFFLIAVGPLTLYVIRCFFRKLIKFNMSYISSIRTKVKFAQQLFIYELDIKVSKMTGWGCKASAPSLAGAAIICSTPRPG